MCDLVLLCNLVVCFLACVVGCSGLECDYRFPFYMVYFLFVPLVFSFNLWLNAFFSNFFVILFFRIVAFVLFFWFLNFLGVIVFFSPPLNAMVVDSLELSSIKSAGAAAKGGASSGLPKAKPIFIVGGEGSSNGYVGDLIRYKLSGSYFSRSSSISSSSLSGSSLFSPVISRPNGGMVLDMGSRFPDSVSTCRMNSPSPSSVSSSSIHIPADLTCLYFTVPVITVGLILLGVGYVVF